MNNKKVFLEQADKDRLISYISIPTAFEMSEKQTDDGFQTIATSLGIIERKKFILFQNNELLEPFSNYYRFLLTQTKKLSEEKNLDAIFLNQDISFLPITLEQKQEMLKQNIKTVQNLWDYIKDRNSESKKHIFHLLLIYEGLTSLVKSQYENQARDSKVLSKNKKQQFPVNNKEKNMIKLLQWNIWNKEDIDNIIKELKRIKADIVCIQELAIKDDNDIKIRKLKEVYPYIFYEKADTFIDYSQCNAILSKYPLYDKQYIYVQTPSQDKNRDYSKEGRVYVEAKVKVNNKELTIGTTHLSYTDRFKETKFKDKEVTNLISCIKKDNYILTGDFNTNKTSKYIKWIEKILVNNDTSNTWTTKPFSYNGFEETELNWKLDYIFTSRDIKVKETKLVDTKYSDHLPIIIEVEL